MKASSDRGQKKERVLGAASLSCGFPPVEMDGLSNPRDSIWLAQRRRYETKGLQTECE
jgi:hypothetical protein